jgi:hypothetical protein
MPDQPAAKPTLPQPKTAPKPAIRYVDRPDCPETFADSVHSVVFDGQTLRVEFGVTRMDEARASMPTTGRRYPAARLVLPPAAAVELINKMQQTAAAMAKAGLLKTTEKPEKPGKP